MSGLVERAPGIDAGRAGVGRRRLTLKQALLGMAGAIGLAAAATYGEHYWQVGRFEVETDDAYVRANSIIIAPRVAGYIAEVLVNDNQPVKTGQVLARIDDRDLRTALDQAIADREAAEHKVANLAAQLQLQQSLIDRSGGAACLGRGCCKLRRAGPEALRRSCSFRRGQCPAGTTHPVAACAARRRSAACPRHPDQQPPASGRAAHRAVRGEGRAGTCTGGRAAGAAEPGLRDHRRAGRRHGRRPHTAGRVNTSRPARS